MGGFFLSFMLGFTTTNEGVFKKMSGKYLKITDEKILNFYGNIIKQIKESTPANTITNNFILYDNFLTVFERLYIRLNEVLGEENVDAVNDYIILKMPEVFYTAEGIKYPRTVHFLILSFFDYSFYYYNLVRTYIHEQNDQHWVHASVPKPSNIGSCLPVVCRGEGIVAILHNDIITELTELVNDASAGKPPQQEKIENLVEKIELFVIQQAVGMQKQQGSSFFSYNIDNGKNKKSRIVPDQVNNGTYIVKNEDNTYSIYNPLDDTISLKETLFSYIISPYRIKTKNIKVNLEDGTSKNLPIVTEFTINLDETFSFETEFNIDKIALQEKISVKKSIQKLRYELSKTYNLLHDTYDIFIKNNTIAVVIKEEIIQQEIKSLTLKDISFSPLKDILTIPIGPYNAYHIKEILPSEEFIFKGNIYRIKRQNIPVNSFYNSDSLPTLLSFLA